MTHLSEKTKVPCYAKDHQSILSIAENQILRNMSKIVEKGRAKMQQISCVDLIKKCPTPWHFEAYVRALNMAHFASLHEMPGLQKGQKYLLTHGGMMCGVFLPHNTVEKLIIYACHTDSPGLKVKPQGLYISEGMTLLNLEIYGFPILASWVGRPLYITGKVWGENRAGQVLEWLLPRDSIPAIIPHIAIHLDRNVNESFQIQKQEMLSCIVSQTGSIRSFEELLQPFIPDLKRIHFHDLFVVPKEESSLQESIGFICPRLDNLSSAWALISSFHEMQVGESEAHLFLFCNHEEIGSETSEGAYSALVQDLVDYVLQEASVEAQLMIKAKSSLISCDAAHAVHPLLADRHDSRHKVFLGKGIALKLNSQYKYSSPPEKVAQAIALFQKENIPYQIFTSRNDIPCGSTVGPILSARLGIKAIDIGAPILSMHAAIEMGSLNDIEILKIAIQKLTSL